MANFRHPQTGTVGFQNFDFRSARNFDDFPDSAWAARPSGSSFTSPFQYTAPSRPSISSSLPSLKSDNSFDFSSPVQRSSFIPSSSDLLQSGFTNLLAGGHSVPTSSPDQPVVASHHRISNYLSDQNSPWVSLSQIPISPARKSRPHRPSVHFEPGSYRTNPNSEVDSFVTGICASDSGYQSHSRGFSSQSVRSADAIAQYQPEEATDIIQQFDTLYPFDTMPGSSPGTNKPVDTKSSSPARSRGGKRTCEVCQKILKCPSDHTKHMLKHTKPHKCDVSGCTRTDGFITVNDLMRHKKSVHKLGVDSITRSFKCASPNCKSPEKVWPRLDNFKQHIIRMHPDEDVKDLIVRSEIRSQSTDGDTTKPSLERDLAGMDGGSKYPEEVTVTPDDLQMRPHSHQAVRFEHSRMGSSQRQAVNVDTTLSTMPTLPPSRAQQCNNHAFDNQNHNNPSRTHGGPQTSLNLLAETALAKPATSVPNSVNMPSRVSSITPVSPKKTIRIQDQKSTHTAHLVESFKAVAKELGTASELERKRFVSAVRSVAEDTSSLVKTRVSGERSPLRNPYDSNQETKTDSAGEEEKLRKGIAVIAALGRQTSGGQGSQRKAVVKPNDAFKMLIKCPHPPCTTEVDQQCKMKKHVLRHTQPWGCVAKGCYRSFGAKSDWARHDNNVHTTSSLASFYCSHLDLDAGYSKCRYVAHDEQIFDHHLLKAHGILDKGERWATLERYQIGPRDVPRFWCGFCLDTVPNTARNIHDRKNRFNDRYDHIDEHFGKGARAKDWIHWDTNEPKGLCKEEKLPDVKVGFVPTISEVVVTSQDSSVESPNPRKRKNSGDKSSTESEWYCCECNGGPWLAELHKRCNNYDADCNHDKCDKCVGNRKRAKIAPGININGNR